MSEAEKETEDKKKAGINDFLYAQNLPWFAELIELDQKNLNKGELALKHAVGLGVQPSVIPEGEPVHDGPSRKVELGWHPVGGGAGKWFAERTGVGKLITQKVNKYPDPTQHWAVLVGGFAHQLWMDENFDVIYFNSVVEPDDWRTFEVGETQFNDDALRRTGESVIQLIREKRPAYNLISNNCQTYALQLLDAIKVSTQKELGTTLAVYERVFGPGKVADLFPKHEATEEEAVAAAQQGQQEVAEDKPPAPAAVEGGDGIVSFAQKLMNENTIQLDTKEQADKSRELGEDDEEMKEDGEEKSNENGKRDAKGEVKAQLKSLFSRFGGKSSS